MIEAAAMIGAEDQRLPRSGVGTAVRLRASASNNRSRKAAGTVAAGAAAATSATARMSARNR